MKCEAMVGASVMVGNIRAHIAQRQCEREAKYHVTHYHLIGTAPAVWKEAQHNYCPTHANRHRQRPNCWYPSWYKHAIIERG